MRWIWLGLTGDDRDGPRLMGAWGTLDLAKAMVERHLRHDGDEAEGPWQDFPAGDGALVTWHLHTPTLC
jgi:hypothetical protein